MAFVEETGICTCATLSIEPGSIAVERMLVPVLAAEVMAIAAELTAPVLGAGVVRPRPFRKIVTTEQDAAGGEILRLGGAGDVYRIVGAESDGLRVVVGRSGELGPPDDLRTIRRKLADECVPRAGARNAGVGLAGDVNIAGGIRPNGVDKRSGGMCGERLNGSAECFGNKEQERQSTQHALILPLSLFH
jgi:hypothetical protein